jgi:hypothetical protein
MELLVVTAILTTILLFVYPLTLRLIRRSQTTATVREVYATVLATRMLAVRSGSNAIVAFDLPSGVVRAWIDTNGNFQQEQDGTEPTKIFFWASPSITRFAFPRGGGSLDIAFDTYNGDKKLANIIVFRPDGTVVSPECAKCNAPTQLYQTAPDVPYGSISCRGTNLPSHGLPPLHGTWNGNNGFGCRGIFITRMVGDQKTDDVFRISVDDRGGRVSLLKWVGPDSRNGLLFTPPNPAWTWFD